MDDSRALDRLRTPGGIAAILAKTAPPEREALKETETLPDPGAEYRAYARAAPEPLIALHLLLADHTIENYQYGEMTSRSRFLPFDPAAQGNLLRLQFCGPGMPEVLIAGRNLRALFDLLTQHRCAWVQELPAGWDFGGDAPVVTHIGVCVDGQVLPAWVSG